MNESEEVLIVQDEDELGCWWCCVVTISQSEITVRLGWGRDDTNASTRNRTFREAVRDLERENAELERLADL
jgi:hypothetical protein